MAAKAKHVDPAVVEAKLAKLTPKLTAVRGRIRGYDRFQKTSEINCQNRYG